MSADDYHSGMQWSEYRSGLCGVCGKPFDRLRYSSKLNCWICWPCLHAWIQTMWKLEKS